MEKKKRYLWQQQSRILTERSSATYLLQNTPVEEEELPPGHQTLPESSLVERFADPESVVVQEAAVQHEFHVAVVQRCSALSNYSDYSRFVLTEGQHVYRLFTFTLTEM